MTTPAERTPDTSATNQDGRPWGEDDLQSEVAMLRRIVHNTGDDFWIRRAAQHLNAIRLLLWLIAIIMLVGVVLAIVSVVDLSSAVHPFNPNSSTGY